MSAIKSKKYTGVYYRLSSDGKDKTYYFVYKDTNDKKHKWVNCGKHSEGIREGTVSTLRSEQLSKMRHGEDITVVADKKKKDIITLDDLAQTYFKDAKTTKHRQNKYHNYIQKPFGNKDIQSIDKQSIKKLLDEVQAMGRANQTVNGVRELLSAIYNHSIKEHNLQIINPCTGIKKLQVDNSRERYLSSDEIQLLKEHLQDNFTLLLFIELSLLTGGRLETVLNIRKKDIDLNHRTVTLKNHKTGKTYTGYLENDEVIQTLQGHLKKININDFVLSFDNHKAQATKRQIQCRLKPILDRLFNEGLAVDDRQNRVVIHTLRHTFASHLAINGTPIFTIQKLMNHADIKQTLRYAKLSPENGKNAVRGLYR